MTQFHRFATARLWFLFALLGLIASSQQQFIPFKTQQFFEYKNEVSMTDLLAKNAKEARHYTLTTTVTIRSVWDQNGVQLLLVTMHNPKVQTSGDTQEVPKIIDKPYYIVVDNGRVTQLLADRSRDAYLLNLRRSVASLLNFHLENGPVPETDISGDCIVFYSAKSSTRFEKIKSDCSNWDLKVSYRSEPALGVEMKPSLTVEYTLAQDGSLLKVQSRETHSLALHAKPDAGSRVESLITFRHVSGAEVEQMKFDNLNDTLTSLENFRSMPLLAEVDGATSEIKDESLRDRTAQLKDELVIDHIGTNGAALTLVKLLSLSRITKTSEFVEILNGDMAILSQVIDLLGATQTIDAHNAIFEVFKVNKDQYIDFIERYLQALAVGTQPNREIIEDLFSRIKSQKINDPKLLETFIQTTASLARQSTFGHTDELVNSFREYLVEQLTTVCTDVECKNRFIRALQNLKDVTTIPQLIKLALEGEAKVSITALQALRSFPTNVFSESDRAAFDSIFYQKTKKYDSSSRTLALDVLFDMRLTKDQLIHLLDYLASNDKQYEVKTYVLQKIRMVSEKCPRFSSLLKSCLLEKPDVHNYNVIAQKGLTTVLHREVSRAPAFNETLLSIQEISNGVLKRGSVELILKTKQEEISTFKLGIYTSGLSSIVGDSSGDDDDDDSTVAAGMEISVQGVLLRPLVFFNGQSELMGHVWSGTASEPTAAFLATTLVQDHEHYVILSNGATVYLRVQGARSIDLNGQVEFSLWNRNAHTEINQSSGTGIVGSMILATSFVRVENTFTLTNEPQISLNADIDFYSGIKLCIQLGIPESILWHQHEKSITLTNEWQYANKITTKRGHKLPGKTLALNQKNNEMCNMIFSD